MGYYCNSCLNLMTDKGRGLDVSIGPCECCLKQSEHRYRSHYVWSEKNFDVYNRAVQELREKPVYNLTAFEKAILAKEDTKAEEKENKEPVTQRRPRHGMDGYVLNVQDAITGERLGYVAFKTNGKIMVMTPQMVRRKQVIDGELPDEVADFLTETISRLEQEIEIDRAKEGI